VRDSSKFSRTDIVREDLSTGTSRQHTEPGDLTRGGQADELLAAKKGRASARMRVTGDEVDEVVLPRRWRPMMEDDLLGRDGRHMSRAAKEPDQQIRESAHLKRNR